MLTPVAGELCKRNMKLVEVYTMQSYDKSIKTEGGNQNGFCGEFTIFETEKRIYAGTDSRAASSVEAVGIKVGVGRELS